MQVPVGQSLLEAAHANDVDLEGEAKSAPAQNLNAWPHILSGYNMVEAYAQLPDNAVTCAGACEGSLACSTCHVVLEVSAAGSSGVRQLSSMCKSACMPIAFWDLFT